MGIQPANFEKQHRSPEREGAIPRVVRYPLEWLCVTPLSERMKLDILYAEYVLGFLR
jgi:hypothetical protein